MIPDFQTIMLPLLQSASDGKEHSLRDISDTLSGHFGLTEEERRKRLASGAPVMVNRVGWAKTYLSKAGLVETTVRGHFRITNLGRDVLKRKPARVDRRYLSQFAEFKEFHEKRSRRVPQGPTG